MRDTLCPEKLWRCCSKNLNQKVLKVFMGIVESVQLLGRIGVLPDANVFKCVVGVCDV